MTTAKPFDVPVPFEVNHRDGLTRAPRESLISYRNAPPSLQRVRRDSSTGCQVSERSRD